MTHGTTPHQEQTTTVADAKASSRRTRSISRTALGSRGVYSLAGGALMHDVRRRLARFRQSRRFHRGSLAAGLAALVALAFSGAAWAAWGAGVGGADAGSSFWISDQMRPDRRLAVRELLDRLSANHCARRHRSIPQTRHVCILPAPVDLCVSGPGPATFSGTKPAILRAFNIGTNNGTAVAPNARPFQNRCARLPSLIAKHESPATWPEWPRMGRRRRCRALPAR